MSAQTILALILVLLAGGWLVGRALRRARQGSDPCTACIVKSQTSCGPGPCSSCSPGGK
jgi:hypothetical protein